MRKAWGTLLHWGFLQWRPRQGSDILSRHHTALWTLGFWFKCYPDSPKPLSPSLLQASVLPSITGNGIVLYIRDDAVIRGLILWNMPVREWLFHWCFCLSWIFFLLISEVSYRKKKKNTIENPGVDFTPGIYKSICLGGMSMIIQWTNHYSPAKIISFQTHLRLSHYFSFFFLIFFSFRQCTLWRMLFRNYYRN